ncbi:MAG: hypothetical protein Q4B85_01980 [Lachnospiraceae bacterium]|nr:hypothetical protein [Lachnospiraceae bacterium]
MLYEVIYTRWQGSLTESNVPEPIGDVVKQLYLEKLSGGENTILWRKTGSFYALVSCRKISDPEIQSRTFPLVIGLLLDETEGRKLMQDPTVFSFCIHVLRRMSYHCAEAHLEGNQMKYACIADWIGSTGVQELGQAADSEGECSREDQCLLHACILSGLLQEKRIYLQRDISPEMLISVIAGLPFVMQEQLSFSVPSGEVPEGECMLNIVKGKERACLSADGYAVNVERVVVEGRDSFEKPVNMAAKELCYVREDEGYREYLEQYSLQNLYKKLGFINRCRGINNSAIGGTSIAEQRTFIWNNRKQIEKILSFIDSKGIADEMQRYLETDPESEVLPEMEKTDPAEAPLEEGCEAVVKAVKRKETGTGRRRAEKGQRPSFYLLTFLISALVSGLLLTEVCSFGTVKTLCIKLVAEPKQLAVTVFLQVMVFSAYHLMENRRKKKDDVCTFECPYHCHTDGDHTDSKE